MLVPDTRVRILIIIAAAASDWLDGWWARTRGPATGAGAVLDPITDKVFVVAALTGFLVSGDITAMQLAILLARDLFVLTGFLVVLALRLPVRLQARFPGKLLTNVQIAAILVLLLAPEAADIAVAATAAAGGWAILDYGLAGIRSLRQTAVDG